MKRRIPQPLVIGLIVLGFAVAGLGGWFMLISPQRSKAAELDTQIADPRGEEGCPDPCCRPLPAD